jgi:hypothetical protein
MTTSSPPLPAAAAPATVTVTAGRFLATAVATALVNLLLHAGTYFLFLRDFYRAHPAGSEEFVRQLHKTGDQLVAWAMVVTSLSLGLFITTAMRWSNARTLREGAARGTLLGVLFWVSVNSALYASSNLFSLPSALLDTLVSAGCMAASATLSAWMLRRS